VFPDTTPFTLKSDGEYFYAPGVCDDTSSLAIMLMVTKFIIKNNVKPSRGILIVANSCEEGLGNLKGTRKLFEDYKGRIKEFYTFDGNYHKIAHRCVGSHRYEIECLTEGGHSWSAFGKTNAIHQLSRLINSLYSVELPTKEDCKTTFNVGVIEGGTSVNTISQNAKMLYEYRSDDADCLAYMKDFFYDTIKMFNDENLAKFNVKLVGDRPCGKDYDETLHESMIEKVMKACKKVSGVDCIKKSSSTDCNIPMSQGVPAVCVGIYDGCGEHTREEKLLISSMPIGMGICFEIMLDYFN
jgi:di/tripeptidase